MNTRVRPSAFERFVDASADDVSELLAYALYERDKRELLDADGITPERLADHHILLSSGQIDLYKSAAYDRLERFALIVVDEVKPQLEEETRTQAIDRAKAEIIATVRAGTSWRTVVLFNVVAWLLTLAITFLIAVGFGNLTLTVNPAS